MPRSSAPPAETRLQHSRVDSLPRDQPSVLKRNAFLKEGKEHRHLISVCSTSIPRRGWPPGGFRVLAGHCAMTSVYDFPSPHAKMPRPAEHERNGSRQGSATSTTGTQSDGGRGGAPPSSTMDSGQQITEKVLLPTPFSLHPSLDSHGHSPGLQEVSVRFRPIPSATEQRSNPSGALFLRSRKLKCDRKYVHPTAACTAWHIAHCPLSTRWRTSFAWEGLRGAVANTLGAARCARCTERGEECDFGSMVPGASLFSRPTWGRPS